jgi:16S rRNA (adenine1518-N6/adenine1519-N6)-dimethyltransferase
MSYLSVFVQNVAAAEIVGHVPATSFEPPPEVDSAILRLRRRASPQIAVGPGREPFYRIVQAGFRQRRKQLHNALGRELPVPRGVLEAAFADCGIDSERRAQTLSLGEWECLTDRLATSLSPPAPSDR